MSYLTAERAAGSFLGSTVLPIPTLVRLRARLRYSPTVSTTLRNIFKRNRHDYGTQRALLRLVGKRRKSLDYLKKVDIERYRAIVKALNLRK